MSTLAEQLQSFARERGGTLRYGKQRERPPSIGQEIPNPKPLQPKPLSDPYIEFTDDYSLWARTHRGE